MQAARVSFRRSRVVVLLLALCSLSFAASWAHGTYTWTPANRSGVASVIVDPDHVLPDDSRGNNTMKANTMKAP